MTRYRVVFRPEAAQQLEELYDFIADAGAPGNAADFTESIVAFCEPPGEPSGRNQRI